MLAGEFAEIRGSPNIREGMTRIGQGKTIDLRYRTEFRNWATTLNIKFNASTVSIAQIGNLFNVGGWLGFNN